MKRMIALLFCCASTSAAQYQIQSAYLKDPHLVIGYVDSCARFWEKAYDAANGGFYTNIDQFGNLISSWGTNKNTLNESRDAYGFTRAFQLTGDTTYLTYARRALQFIYAHAWDATYGGWYNDISETGQPIAPTTDKTAYYQHYADLGITAHFEATRDSTDWGWVQRSYAYNDATLWDSSASTVGYYDAVQYTGTNPVNRSFNATVDAITTHVLHLYLMTGEPRYRERLLQLAGNIINRLAASVPYQATGFVEEYNTSWEPDDSQPMTIMGHVLKTAWCLARMYEFERDSTYLTTAEQLVHLVLTKGYDHINGGPYKDYDRITGDMLMWGQVDTAKAWWQMEQAVTVGLFLHRLTGKDEYLQMADETLLFFMKYFVDHEYGEVYSDRTKYGAQIWGLEKGNSGKAGYHSIELGYYVYLYGNLFLDQQPATLYYRIAGTSAERTFTMRPVSVRSPELRIKSVTCNGAPYLNYVADSLTLTLPAGTGGTFAVTYELNESPSSVPLVASHPTGFALAQNYPNPFNPSTTIEFSLAAAGQTSLRVYDLLGKQVALLAEGHLEAGVHRVRWDAGSRATGMYFVQLTSGGYSLTKKMALMK